MVHIPPPTAEDDLVETLHGRQVADPYRWLEDADSPRTAEWVAEQRAHCELVLAGLPERSFFERVMRRVTTRPRCTAPRYSKGRYLQSRNDGTQNQDVVFVAGSLDELLAGGRVLVDPNTWSDDGSVALAALTVAPGGDRIAVARSAAGSDWNTVSVVDADGSPVDDVETTTKFCRPSWLPDGRSYLYNAFPGAGRAEGNDNRVLPPPHLMVHTVGDDPSQDREVWSFADEPQALGWAVVSDDERWLVVHVSLGTERSCRVWLFGLGMADGISVVGDRLELIDKATAEWTFVGDRAGELYFVTDDDAANSRVVAIDTDGWTLREVVPESAHPIAGAELAGDVLVLETLVDAQPVLRRFDLRGRDLGRVEVPGGAVVSLTTRDDSSEAFLGVSTLVDPLVPYRLDADTGELAALATAAAGWQPPSFTVERRRATSSDGQQVPYFLVVPDGVALDQSRPTMLYGYGGFSVPVAADHRAIWPGWLAAGGVIVIANLRGGGEFGRDWYDAGRQHRKQQVFDDAIAVAEQLVADGVTTPGQLAVHGKSNGGLLVGALLTQRPDLFAAALPHVGVLDGLRFHKFTLGRAWVSDYGDPDEADDFDKILAWSPLHNIRPGTSYPATLVLTSDHDDRVAPAHSFKFAAALQAAQAGGKPVVARIESATGHGLATKPPAVLAAECADLLAFAAHFTGLLTPGGREGR